MKCLPALPDNPAVAEQQIVSSNDSEDFPRHIRRETGKCAGAIRTLGIEAE